MPTATKHAPAGSQPVIEFSGQIEPVKVPVLYQLGLLAVALVMVLLPLVYLAMIAGVAYLMYLHITNAPNLFSGRSSGRGAVAVLLGPLVIGGILLLFMIKPLFARASRAYKPVTLRREDEPRLFLFIERLCAVVGAPVPSAIDVDCDVNASAGFRRGVWSLFGNDLRLTIGLPLVAALNLR